MHIDQAKKKLHSLGQDLLLQDPAQSLLEEIEGIDEELFFKQAAALRRKAHTVTLDPLVHYDRVDDIETEEQGKSLIAKGAVGCLVAAGGQGTRLGFAGPKGMLPLLGKTLYQRLAEKTLCAGRNLPLVIMTSSATDEPTRSYFRKHGRFGLTEEQLIFFQQSDLPFLDEEGRLFLASSGHLALGPDGNGRAFHHIVSQGIADRLRARGLRYLHFVPIDNVLADPFDAALVGFHAKRQADATIKAAFRRDPQEKVGVIGKKRGHTVVVEYSELAEEERFARRENGSLKHRVANLSLFCFSLDFVDRVADKKLPLHIAKKTADHQGKGKVAAWKSEYFIFDVLSYARHVEVLVYPRERCFAPLKNAAGPDSPETAEKALYQSYPKLRKSAQNGYAGLFGLRRT